MQVEHGVTEKSTGLVNGCASQQDDATCAYARCSRTVQAQLCAGCVASFHVYADEVLLRANVLSWLIETGTRWATGTTPCWRIIAHGPTRAAAIEKLRAALLHTRVHGIETSLPFLHFILGNEIPGRSPRHALLGALTFRQPKREVNPAQPPCRASRRLDYWDVGVPPGARGGALPVIALTLPVKRRWR